MDPFPLWGVFCSELCLFFVMFELLDVKYVYEQLKHSSSLGLRIG